MTRPVQALLLVFGLVLQVLVNTAVLADRVRAHVICPEHGDMVEVGASAGREIATIEAAPAGGHGHCALAQAYLPPGAPPPAPALAEILPAPEPLADRVRLAPAHAPPALARAPKTSPPGA